MSEWIGDYKGISLAVSSGVVVDGTNILRCPGWQSYVSVLGLDPAHQEKNLMFCLT
jgi:hypothetical protein